MSNLTEVQNPLYIKLYFITIINFNKMEKQKLSCNEIVLFNVKDSKRQNFVLNEKPICT